MPHPSSSEGIALWIAELAKANLLMFLQQILTLALQRLPAWLFSKELAFCDPMVRKAWGGLGTIPTSLQPNNKTIEVTKFIQDLF